MAGTWINGENLYRQVFTGLSTGGASKTVTFDLGVAGVRQILPMTTVCISSSDQTSFPGSDGTYQWRYEFDIAASKLTFKILKASNAWTNRTIDLVLYYTKNS